MVLTPLIAFESPLVEVSASLIAFSLTIPNEDSFLLEVPFLLLQLQVFLGMQHFLRFANSPFLTALPKQIDSCQYLQQLIPV